MNTADPAAVTDADLAVRILGEAHHASPLASSLQARASSAHYVDETDRVLLDDTVALAAGRGLPTDQLPSLEPGGPRRRIFFDPATTRVGIVTCGGLCPGLNNVIRALVLELTERYGITGILGFPDGYRGLVPGNPRRPVVLTADSVHDIHGSGGTILGTSRGDQEAGGMVDTLQALGICVLFVIGGDGTLRGAQKIADAALARGYPLAVVGVPKTIDNDIPFLDQSFGFQTAYGRAAESIRAAHTEASSTPGGVGLVKLMGRHSGFIACYAAVANHDTDFVLVPEVPFTLDGPHGVLRHLRDRVAERGHAVVVVAEGAGQDLLTDHAGGTDASGNTRLGDIGQLLSARIRAYFAEVGAELNLRYIDPGYAIRSVPANPQDGVFCIRLAQAAVHAAMAGRTAMVVGRWHGRFVHVPISLATASRNVVDPEGDLWMSVLEVTGQPARFT